MAITYGPTPPPPPTGMSQAYCDVLREDLQEDTIQTLGKFVNNRAGYDILTQYKDVRTDYGARGDGVTDDTSAFQAALDYFTDNEVSGILNVPTGTYKITSTLTYTGSNTTSIHMKGASDMYLVGSTLLFSGEAGDTLFNTKGMVKSTFEDINFHGNELAKYTFHQESNQPDGGSSSYGNKWFRCTITGAAGVDSACFAIGTSGGSDTHQVSENDFFGCTVGSANTVAAFKQLCGGNTKNCIRYYGGEINRGEILVDCTVASGSYIFSGMYTGAASSKFFKFGSTAFVTFDAVEAETDGDDQAIFLEGAATSNAGSVKLTNCDINIKGPNDDLCIKWYGGMVIVGGQFWNSRQGDTTNLFKIAIAAQASVGLSGPGSLYSLGVHYANSVADTYAPFNDDGGNAILGTNDARLNGRKVFSFGDYGGPFGSGKQRLKDIFGDYLQVNVLETRNGTKAPDYSGRITDAKNRWTFSYTDFQAAALFKDIDLFEPTDGEGIRRVRFKVTTPFAGTAGTLLFRIGDTIGGDEIITDQDAETAATYGDDSAHWGTEYAAKMADGGFYCQASIAVLKLRLTSSSGNLSGLNAGAVTVWVERDPLP